MKIEATYAGQVVPPASTMYYGLLRSNRLHDSSSKCAAGRCQSYYICQSHLRR